MSWKLRAFWVGILVTQHRSSNAETVQTRIVDWDGFLNARDLGGLPTHHGQPTRFKSVIRSEHPSHLTSTGWRQLHAAGVSTIVSLYTDGLDDGALAGTLDSSSLYQHGHQNPLIAHRPIAVEDGDDEEFMQRWGADTAAGALDGALLATPAYWSDALTRWPGRYAAAVAAVADAPAGTVLLHCGRGCDRTGLVVALLLTLAGVGPRAVAEDYALSATCLRPRLPSYREDLTQVLAARGQDVVSCVAEQLAAVDVEGLLLAGGLDRAQMQRVRQRLLAAV